MNFNTDTLRSLLTDKSGLAAGNRWMVVLPPLNGKKKVGGGSPSNYSSDDLNMLCTSARIPGKQLRTIERTVGVVSSRTAVGFEPGDASFTFYLTHDYTVRRYFQDWIDCVIAREAPYDVGFFDEYKGDILVHQLDKKGTKTYKSKLKEAYPVNMAEIELNNQAQTAALELTVTIAYKDYEII